MSLLVLDASTAILLAKVGILRRVVERTTTWIGAAAANEVLRKGSDDAVAIAILLEEGKLRHVAATEGLDTLVHDFRIHTGEAEAVALARSNDAVCGTDDARAIRSCKALGVRFTTAIGLLVAMAEAGEIEPARAYELLLQLERFGRYHARILEDATLRIRALERSGEDR